MDISSSPQFQLGPRLGRTGSLPNDFNPQSLSPPPQSLKEHARGFQPSGSARISFLQQFSRARRAQRFPPFPLPLSPRERRHSAGVPATGPSTLSPELASPCSLHPQLLGSTGKPGSASPSLLGSWGQRKASEETAPEFAGKCREGRLLDLSCGSRLPSLHPAPNSNFSPEAPTLVWRLRLTTLRMRPRGRERKGTMPFPGTVTSDVGATLGWWLHAAHSSLRRPRSPPPGAMKPGLENFEHYFASK